MKKIDSILKEVLERITPPKEDMLFIEDTLKKFLIEIKKRIKKEKIKAEIFVGGSFAKNTVISKDNYDVDVFIRFDKSHKDISKLTKKLLRGMKSITLIHGSRDYFRMKISPYFFIELVPVRKISNPKEANNITDLSYSHVNYITKKIKNKKILDDIKITKAFCYATNTYGAESYISGFSGYAIELLVYHYKGFMNLIKAMAKVNNEKEVIDIEKQYKNKKSILLDMNASKLMSPVILIDPTYPQRNVLAALSKETFEKFQKACKEFIKNPSIKAFELKKVDLEKIKAQAIRKKQEFILIEAKTNKQKGDIAGSKLLKFFKYFGREISNYFDIVHNGFSYDGNKSGIYYFVVNRKKEFVFNGPFIHDKKSVGIFKKKHKNTFIEKGKIYAREKIDFNLEKFILNWEKKHNQRLKEMSIIDLKII